MDAQSFELPGDAPAELRRLYELTMKRKDVFIGCLEAITRSIANVGSNFGSYSVEFQKARFASDDVKARIFRSVGDRLAVDFNAFASSLTTLVDELSIKQSQFVDSIAQSFRCLTEQPGMPAAVSAVLGAQLESMENTTGVTYYQERIFRGQIRSQPDYSSAFAEARGRAVLAMDGLIRELWYLVEYLQRCRLELDGD